MMKAVVADAPWSITQESSAKQLIATLSCDKKPFVGNFQTCSLALSHITSSGNTANKTLKNIAITIGGGMPEHQHGLPTSPIIKWSDKDNIYHIQGLKFSMPGPWVLHFYMNGLDKLKIEKDTVTFNLTL
jgi:hypothetical protein